MKQTFMFIWVSVFTLILSSCANETDNITPIEREKPSLMRKATQDLPFRIVTKKVKASKILSRINTRPGKKELRRINFVSGLPFGLYGCDIYKYYAEVEIPEGAILNFNAITANKLGMTNPRPIDSGDFNIDLNVTYQPSTRTLIMDTWNIHILFDLSAKYIGRIYPVDLEGLEFEYSYFVIE